MKKGIFIVCILILSFLVISIRLKKTERTEVSGITELLRYRNSYVGDNSAVANIILNLDGSKYFKHFALQTREQPYGIEIRYGVGPNSSRNEFGEYWTDAKTKVIFLNSATALLALVKNVDSIKFSLETAPQRTWTVSRTELEKFYGSDLRLFAASEAKWNKTLVTTIHSRARVAEFWAHYATEPFQLVN